MRYAKPRKLKTKRAQLKAERNAWCIVHRKPMSRHGKHFWCEGHWSTMRQATSDHLRPFAVRSLATTGSKKRFADVRDNYPYCLTCKIRMCRKTQPSKRYGRINGYKCRNCNSAVTIHSIWRGEADTKLRQAIGLLQQGYPITYVAKTLKMGYNTVSPLIKTVDRRLCKCGQIFFHRRRCVARKPAPAPDGFEHIMVRVRKRFQMGLPEEMREDLAAMMLFDIAADIEKRLSSAQDYIRQYKKMYPLQFHSLDADPKLAERIEG